MTLLFLKQIDTREIARIGRQGLYNYLLNKVNLIKTISCLSIHRVRSVTESL